MKNKDMKYLTVMDFSSGTIHQFEVNFQDIDLGGGDTLSQHEQCEVFLGNEGFRFSDIEWMIHKNGTIIKGQKL